MKVTISELRASLGALLDRYAPIARIVPLAADGPIIEPASAPVSP